MLYYSAIKYLFVLYLVEFRSNSFAHTNRILLAIAKTYQYYYNNHNTYDIGLYALYPDEFIIVLI